MIRRMISIKRSTKQKRIFDVSKKKQLNNPARNKTDSVTYTYEDYCSQK